MKKIIFKLCCLSGILLLANQLKAQNLLTVNEGFESGKTGWYFSGANVQLVNDDAHSGKTSLKVISQPGSITLFYSDPKVQKMTLSAGKKYELRMWVKPLSKVREFELKVYSSSGYKAEQDVSEIVKNKPLKINEWQQLSIPFTSNDYQDAKFSIALGIGEILFDDLALVEVK